MQWLVFSRPVRVRSCPSRLMSRCLLQFGRAIAGRRLASELLAVGWLCWSGGGGVDPSEAGLGELPGQLRCCAGGVVGVVGVVGLAAAPWLSVGRSPMLISARDSVF